MPSRSRGSPEMRADDDELVGAVAVQHDALLAVEHAAARRRASRRGRDVGEVVARLPLGVREREQSACPSAICGSSALLLRRRCRRGAASRRRARRSRDRARARARGRTPPSRSWSRPARRRSRRAPRRTAAPSRPSSAYCRHSVAAPAVRSPCLRAHRSVVALLEASVGAVAQDRSRIDALASAARCSVDSRRRSP